MNADGPVRVVAVDDQPVFRRAAAALIAGTPGFELVGQSADGESALRLVPEVDPDMVIVDVRMPGMDGIEVAGRLREQDPERVIVLASSLDPRDLAIPARSVVSAVVRKQWLTPRLLRGLWVAHRRR
jgi:two-component system, NarL family, invasion response regulator UvrY